MTAFIKFWNVVAEPRNPWEVTSDLKICPSARIPTMSRNCGSCRSWS
jgi:hypothetical protein